ncbi:MAG TPA: hypothetical protein VHL80_15755 [Polyangia bacterium]|nr:hypothetical protein [Polyangia bacterium]
MDDRTPDAETLERLRRSGIRIDREGRFIHEGEEVRHEGLRRALFRWLDAEPDGRVVLRLDARRFAYVDVDDTPLVARAARLEGERALLALSDGAEEALDPATLTVDDAGVLRARARGGRLAARLATDAVAALAARLSEEPPGRPVLTLAGRRWEIPRRPPR